MGLFKRQRRAATDTGGLGESVVALRLQDGDVLPTAPAGATLVIFNAAGYARRGTAGRIAPDEGETVYGFYPGPYSSDLTPFAAAPELGLRLRFVIDAADPRVTQQRFDLFLFSEAGARLTVDAFGAAMEAALQAELSQGNLDLPPCTTLEEWHAFRAGLNQLLYTRFGITVDDCVPVDLGERVDFAQILAARVGPMAIPTAAAAALALPATAVAAAAAVVPVPVPGTLPATPLDLTALQTADAGALRRLFLELPALTSAVRLLALPAGQPLFQFHQRLLQRLALIALSVGTMPSLSWAAPDQALPPLQQSRRADDSALAIQSLDQAWALLGRLQLAVPAQLDELLDDADRIVANLEHHLLRRRATDLSTLTVDADAADMDHGADAAAADAAVDTDADAADATPTVASRREPSL